MQTITEVTTRELSQKNSHADRVKHNQDWETTKAIWALNISGLSKDNKGYTLKDHKWKDNILPESLPQMIWAHLEHGKMQDQ